MGNWVCPKCGVCNTSDSEYCSCGYSFSDYVRRVNWLTKEYDKIADEYADMMIKSRKAHK